MCTKELGKKVEQVLHRSINIKGERERKKERERERERETERERGRE